MIDINKQVIYWRDGAIEDWSIAQDLISRGKSKYGSFFAHLALEKLLKAHVCHYTQDLAPRIHNLIRLAELAKLPISNPQSEKFSGDECMPYRGALPRYAFACTHSEGSIGLPGTLKAGVRMVNQTIRRIVRKYLDSLVKQGIPVRFGVIFGSQVSGQPNAESDIDLLVVSPSYDNRLSRKDVNDLWRVAARTDSRIEPVPVGQQQFENDDSSSIIEIARREGEIISLSE